MSMPAHERVTVDQDGTTLYGFDLHDALLILGGLAAMVMGLPAQIMFLAASLVLLIAMLYPRTFGITR